MPHAQRERSESGFYHVVSKGDGGQVIFESDRDRRHYLRELETAAREWEVDIHAYCLMSNHVHLLVGDKNCKLADFMKQLNENYARYFAWRTGRVGHVFQGRYWSEPICSNEYFLSALRYIHANPEAASICRTRDYPWSSYGAYLGRSSMVTTDTAISLLGNRDQFEAFHAEGARDAKPFANSKLKNHLLAEELMKIAISVVGRDVINGLRAMNPKQRVPHLIKLFEAGMNQAEISRATGLGRQTIRTALKQ